MAFLYVTTSPNDDDLAKALGPAAIRADIPCGDVDFYGVDAAPDGTTINVKVLIERKKIADICQCINTGRYLHQLQNAYAEGFRILKLIVEGETKPCQKTGLLLVPGYDYLKKKGSWVPIRPEMEYSRFDQYLTELDDLLGVTVKRSRDVAETAAMVKAIWLYHQKPPSEHTSLEVFYRQPRRVDLMAAPSLMRRIAAELPGLGWDRSREVERHFHSIRDMIDADEKEWLEIEGIGKIISKKIVQSVNTRRA